LVVDAEVSNESFIVTGFDIKGKQCFSDVFPMDRGGFSKFLKTMMGCQPAKSAIVVGMESTGCYHVSLARFFNI